jgi:CTP:molybdopterin cytidylyltransferase MocA
MTSLSLVMPMAGLGSRFSRAGIEAPKPLIELGGRPFFWWAAESVRRAAPVRELSFVVLAAHVARHRIDAAIRRFYPDAGVTIIDAPTAGAAETAAIGVAALRSDGPIAINDCDHAFAAPQLPELAAELARGVAGALVGFASDNPAYSYARLACDGRSVLGTAEKRRVGPYAIAGCYLMRDKATFAGALAGYREVCADGERFLSGLYDTLCRRGEAVRFSPLGAHASFGTPEELARTSATTVADVIREARAR